VERLESLIATGKPLPLTKNVIVDREQALNLIDEMRISLPQEIEAAQRINSDRERIIELAQQEAEQGIGRAQEQAAFLIEERELTRAAEERSQEIIAEARREADEVRAGADAYAASVLVALEGECVKALQSIKRGIALLEERRGTEPDGEEDAEPYDEEYEETEQAATGARL